MRLVKIQGIYNKISTIFNNLLKIYFIHVIHNGGKILRKVDKKNTSILIFNRRSKFSAINYECDHKTLNQKTNSVPVEIWNLKRIKKWNKSVQVQTVHIHNPTALMFKHHHSQCHTPHIQLDKATLAGAGKHTNLFRFILARVIGTLPVHLQYVHEAWSAARASVDAGLLAGTREDK